MFQPTTTNLYSFKINTVDRGAVSLHVLQQNDIYMSTKRNQGHGEQMGDLAPTYSPRNVVNDMDAADANAAKTNAL